MKETGNPESGAVFSTCEKYRYKLWRKWGRGPTLFFILMNPSTADEIKNDPTIERQCRRAKMLGFGGLVILNCGAIRETDSRKAWADPEPIGPANLETIQKEIEGNPSGMFIAGWGAPARRVGADRPIIDLFERVGFPLYCLGVNSDGSPKHPLYVSYQTQPRRYI